MNDIGPMIVVGLDDDPGAAAALRWAVAEARLRAARVQAVYAYNEPVVADVNLVPLDSSPSLEQAQLAAEVWRDTALFGAGRRGRRGVDVGGRQPGASPAVPAGARLGESLLPVPGQVSGGRGARSGGRCLTVPAAPRPAGYAPPRASWR
jgi:nucleotide-binding universal stress UspA family protein